MTRILSRVLMFMLCLNFGLVCAQNNIPAAAKIPSMAYDKVSVDVQASDIDSDLLANMYKVDDFVIVLGETTLMDITQALKAGKVLHDGDSYYQCYSLPRYSHQLWFITNGNKPSAPITEIVVVKDKVLPMDFCPLTTSSAYPMFSNKIYLGLKVDQLQERIGRASRQDGMSNILYQHKVSDFKRLKIQAHAAHNKIDALKVTLGSLLFSESD